MKFGSGSVAPDGCLYVWKPAIYGYVNKPNKDPEDSSRNLINL